MTSQAIDGTDDKPSEMQHLHDKYIKNRDARKDEATAAEGRWKTKIRAQEVAATKAAAAEKEARDKAKAAATAAAEASASASAAAVAKTAGADPRAVEEPDRPASAGGSTDGASATPSKTTAAASPPATTPPEAGTIV